MNSLVVVPTYNEVDNLPGIVESILEHAPQTHILIVDDNSPDGTGALADQLSQARPEQVFVLHRARKEGLGQAYVEGFGFALERGYGVIVQMDADFSHDPKYLPAFFEAIETNDLVIGSRYVNGISVVNWDLKRLILSKAASFYVRLITRMPIADTTTGFKCWRREALEAIGLDQLFSNGYVFLAEMSYRAYRKGMRIKEVPIIFVERRLGRSKMSGGIMIEGVLSVLRMRLRRR
ncbi:MAG TPA: polyprenol monophosphomannose synthase [Pyrinomonadaceae bacterium]|nr:polyprenol monophosphomannose synthase [Pyrinomonadaceae bacterium]